MSGDGSATGPRTAARWGSEKSNVTAVLVAKATRNMLVSGKDGGSAVSAPARWISVQIGQRSSARCSVSFADRQAQCVRHSMPFALPAPFTCRMRGEAVRRLTCPKVRDAAGRRKRQTAPRYEPHLGPVIETVHRRSRACASTTGCSGPSRQHYLGATLE